MMYVFPLTSLAIAALLGFVLGLTRRFLTVLALVLGLGLVFAYASWAPRSGAAADHHFYYAVLSFLVLPQAAAGLLGGTLIGWLVARQRARKT